MKTTKNLMDAMVESSSKTVNNWVETAQKAQKAALSGSSLEKNSELYKEWLSNQMSIFKNISLTDGPTAASEKAEDAKQNMEEFYKNWYSNQLSAFQQMTDFNKKLMESWVNFSTPSNEENTTFGNWNKTATEMYENWMNTMNNTFNNLSKTLKDNLNKEVFENMFQSQHVILKMQEFYAPFYKAMQNGSFNADSFKQYIDPAMYKKNMESMFSNLMPQANMKEFFESYMNQIQNLMNNSQSLAKDFKESLQKFASSYPDLFNGDMSKAMSMYNQMSDNFQKSVAPYLKLVSGGKEKQRIEAAFDTLDKIAIHQIKNAQLQYLIMTSGQSSLEKSMEMVAEKFKSQAEITSFHKFFQEWVNINENTFISLFNSDEYSALRAEVTSLSLAIKKDLEIQFEQQMAVYPFVFKTDMNEVYQTIHDLKNKVKALETQLAALKISALELEDEEPAKTTKSGTRKK